MGKGGGHGKMYGVEQDPGYEDVEHAADWAFRVRGRDLGELFTNAARTIARAEHGGEGEVNVSRELQVTGADRETLLVNWLNELLYLEQTRREVYSHFDIMEIGDTHLRARVQGAPEYHTQRHIKAVTFHNLEVKQTAGGWEATLVVDV